MKIRDKSKQQVVDSMDANDSVLASPKAGTQAQPSVEALARRNRRTKAPTSGRRNILTVKGLDPGMVGRWVDNIPERVEQLLEQGYEPVRKKVQVGDTGIDQGAPMGSVITKRVGGGKEAILMQIPKEWYDADHKEKQKINDRIDAEINSTGKTPGQYGGVKVSDVVPGRRQVVRSED